MSIQGEQILLRAYLDSADRAPHSPTVEQLTRAARKHGLAGATVLEGIAGFGSRRPIPRSGWSLARHVPVILEIVDRGPTIAAFLAGPVAEIMTRGTITLERAHVMLYRHRAHGEPNNLRLGGLLSQPLATLPALAPGANMQTENGVLLRIFIGDSDRFENRPLYEVIVQKARELGLAGATVLRGSEGFGANSVVHTSKLLEMSTDLPLVIEIVDSESNINRLLPHLENMVQEGMITMEHVAILMYRHNSGVDQSERKP